MAKKNKSIEKYLEVLETEEVYKELENAINK